MLDFLFFGLKTPYSNLFICTIIQRWWMKTDLFSQLLVKGNGPNCETGAQ